MVCQIEQGFDFVDEDEHASWLVISSLDGLLNNLRTVLLACN